MARAVLPRKNVGPFNQALMELGGQVCLGKRPCCHQCPVAKLCQAHADGLEATIPAAKPKSPPEARHEAALIVRRRGRVLLLKCPEGGRWAGLWDFPRFLVHSEDAAAIRPELSDNLRSQTGILAEPGRHLKTITHGVTRFRITLDCYDARYVSGPNTQPNTTQIRWLRPAELAHYPLNTTGRKLARLLDSRK